MIKPLSTNQGFNAFAVLVPAMGVVASMPDGPWKWGLLALVCIATTIVGVKTVGDNPDESVPVDDDADLDSVLKRGRK